MYERVYRRTNFSFEKDGKEYTQRVINVTFRYSNKSFNRIRENTYLKFGYLYHELEFEDSVCVRDGELLGIQIDTKVETPLPDELLGKEFYYDAEKAIYKARSNLPVLHTVAELRDKLYKDGFVCDGIKYVRFKRSSGSSRVGKCLFIDEKLYNHMHKWEMCGIKINNGDATDLAALEAYISLTLSSIIDTIEINADNILVIDDYESVFRDDVVVTKLDGNFLSSYPDNVEITNSIWDGQSLLDSSLFGKYSMYGMLLLRNRFFKSCCFNANIQQFFSDNNITRIDQLNGFTLAQSVEDIKLITTPSSIKFLKFGKLVDWLKRLEPMFGVVKHEKPTHNFDGRLVQSHYQLLNTLQLSYEETQALLQPSLDYVEKLKTDPAVLRYHIKYPDEDFVLTPLTSKNEIVYKMIGINEQFCDTKLYYEFRNDLTVSYVKNLRSGHVLINGNYSTLLGNPMEMLLSAIDNFDGTPFLGAGKIHSKRFAYNSIVLGSRSPHVTMGNIWLTTNVASEVLDRYFNLTNEIVCVNSINENVLQRLSGADFDSDTVMLTDNEILIKAAQKNYDRFMVPTSLVSAKKTTRRYTDEEKADLDVKTSVNKIGEIINLAQDLNSLLWNLLNDGATFDDVAELYYDIAKLDVMSGIEIDKAKKEFVVDTALEMKLIKEKYNSRDEQGRLTKPKFFSHLAKLKGYYVKDKHNYEHYKTTMDYVQKAINRARFTRLSKDFCRFTDIINTKNFNASRVKYEQAHRIISLVRDTRTEIQRIWTAKNDLEASSRFLMAADVKQNCIEYINDIRLSKDTMLWLLMAIDNPMYSDIAQMLFEVLFGTPNKAFFELIKHSKEAAYALVECQNGPIDLYGIRYQKAF